MKFALILLGLLSVTTLAEECPKALKSLILKDFGKSPYQEETKDLDGKIVKLPQFDTQVYDCQQREDTDIDWKTQFPDSYENDKTFFVTAILNGWQTPGHKSNFPELAEFVGSVFIKVSLKNGVYSYKVIRETGMTQTECGSSGLEYRLAPEVKIGNRCYLSLQITHRRIPCTGQSSVRNDFIQFLKTDDYNRLALQLEINREIYDDRKYISKFERESVLDLLACQRKPGTFCNGDANKGCKSLPFNRSKTIEAPSKGVITYVPHTDGLQIQEAARKVASP